MDYISLATAQSFTVINNSGFILTTGSLASSGITSNWTNVSSGFGPPDGLTARINTTAGTGILPGLYFRCTGSLSLLSNKKIYGGKTYVVASISNTGSVRSMTGTYFVGYLATGGSNPKLLGGGYTGYINSTGLATISIGSSGKLWTNRAINSEEADALGIALFFRTPLNASGTVYLDSVRSEFKYGNLDNNQVITFNYNDYYNSYRR